MTKPKFITIQAKGPSVHGFLIRLHRIIPQLAFIALFIYLYGLGAILFAYCAFVFYEMIPYGKFDAWVNPWFRKEFEKQKRQPSPRQHITVNAENADQVAMSFIRNIASDAYMLMHDIHQITIDLVERAELELANDHRNITRDDVLSLRYQVELVLEVMNEKHAKDISLLNRLSTALSIWDNDPFWRRRWREPT